MQKRVTVTTCKAHRFNNLPTLVSLGNSSFQSKETQTTQIMSYPYLEKNEKKEIDSLKSVKTRNKTQNINEQIKNIKGITVSRIGENSKVKTKNANNECHGIATSVIKKVPRSNEPNISYIGGRVDVNPQPGMQKQKKADNRSDKKESTEGLSPIIISIGGSANSNGDKGKDIPAPKKVVTCIGDESDLSDDDFNNSDVGQAASELLYQSFFVKAFPVFNRNSDVLEVDVHLGTLSKRKKGKTKESQKPLAKKSKTSNQKQEKSKVNTLTINDSSDSEVEVINIDDDDSNYSAPVNNQVKNAEDKAKVTKVIEIVDNEITPEEETSQKENSDSKKRVWECPICLEPHTGQEVVTTMCGHVFCRKCLDNFYVTYKKTCPTCRADLHNKPVITLFNF